MELTLELVDLEIMRLHEEYHVLVVQISSDLMIEKSRWNARTRAFPTVSTHFGHNLMARAGDLMRVAARIEQMQTVRRSMEGA